jgi:hypothetical protein
MQTLISNVLCFCDMENRTLSIGRRCPKHFTVDKSAKISVREMYTLTFTMFQDSFAPALHSCISWHQEDAKICEAVSLREGDGSRIAYMVFRQFPYR